MERIDRISLAVMFTDVAGFTALMETSERDALTTLKTLRDLQLPLFKSHRGRLVKEMGDGTLSTFPSAVDAVRCARKIQNSLRNRSFRVRIGIHWGEVLMKSNDVLGDPVNVASRIQDLAPPGGVFISEELLRAYGSGRRPLTRSMGLRKLKGLGRLVEIHAVAGTRRRPLPAEGSWLEDRVERAVRTSEMPSIAVMPLLNLGPEDDDFYAYSISVDLVGDLAGAGGLRVTPLSDVLRIREAVGSPGVVAERLKVRFLVKGTLWRRGERFQLSIELLELPAERLLWTDTWTDDWYELPSIKDKMADGVLKALGLRALAQTGATVSESARSGAYEDYLRARELYWKKKSSHDTEKALDLLTGSLEADPMLVPARVLLGTAYCQNGRHGEAEAALMRACDIAMEKGDRPGHLNALNWIGINQWRQSDYGKARNTFLRTLRMARTLKDITGEARSLSNIGLAESNLGNYGRALNYLEKALAACGMDEVSSLRANTLCNLGLTHWHMGDNSLALQYYKKAITLFEILEDMNGLAYTMRNIGIIRRELGQYNEALELTGKAKEIYEKLGDRLGSCHSLNSMGNIHLILGRYDRAMEEYLEALSIAGELDKDWMTGVIKTNLGNIAISTGRYEEALELHSEALHICRSLEDPEGEAENLTHIGEDHSRLGHLEEARAALERSIDIMEELGAGARTILARIFLAGVLLDSEENRSHRETVLEQIEQIQALLTHGTGERATILWRLSGLCARLADTASSKPEENRMRRLSNRCLRDSHQLLMQAAETLPDRESREVFLGKVEEHRAITRAFRRLQEST